MANMAGRMMGNPNCFANLGHFGGRSNRAGQKYWLKECPTQKGEISVVVVIGFVVGVIGFVVVVSL